MKGLKNKFIPKRKFLNASQKAYNSIMLRFQKSYPNIRSQAQDIKNAELKIENQINIIDEILKSFEKYKEEKKEIKGFLTKSSSILFLGFLGLAIVLKTFLNISLIGALLLCEGVALFNEIWLTFLLYPYLGNIIYMHLKGEDEKSLTDYRIDLKKFLMERYSDKNYAKSARVQLALNSKNLQAENHTLSKETKRNRNAALWQTMAFDLEKKVYEQNLGPKDFTRLKDDASKLNMLLDKFHNAESCDKQRVLATEMDATITDMQSIYPAVERPYKGRCRKRDRNEK